MVHIRPHIVCHIFFSLRAKSRGTMRWHTSRRRWEFPWKVARSPHTFLSAHSGVSLDMEMMCRHTKSSSACWKAKVKWIFVFIARMLSMRCCLHFPACETQCKSLSALFGLPWKVFPFVFTHFEFVIANRHRGDPEIYKLSDAKKPIFDLALVLIQWPSYDFLAEINGKFIWANSTFAGGMHVVLRKIFFILLQCHPSSRSWHRQR